MSSSQLEQRCEELQRAVEEARGQERVIFADNEDNDNDDGADNDNDNDADNDNDDNMMTVMMTVDRKWCTDFLP